MLKCFTLICLFKVCEYVQYVSVFHHLGKSTVLDSRYGALNTFETVMHTLCSGEFKIAFNSFQISVIRVLLFIQLLIFHN